VSGYTISEEQAVLPKVLKYADEAVSLYWQITKKMDYLTCKITKQKHIKKKGVRSKGEGEAKGTLNHLACASFFQV
jgi:hypothetical protein